MREMDLNTLFNLTPEQQKAFNRLRKAYADCRALGVVFYIDRRFLGALDSAKFQPNAAFNDSPEEPAILGAAQNIHNELALTCAERSSGPRYFHPLDAPDN